MPFQIRTDGQTPDTPRPLKVSLVLSLLQLRGWHEYSSVFFDFAPLVDLPSSPRVSVPLALLGLDSRGGAV